VPPPREGDITALMTFSSIHHIGGQMYNYKFQGVHLIKGDKVMNNAGLF
jgi:hypothetical protein